MFICLYVYMFMCLKEGRYQYVGMSWAMIVMFKDMVEEHQSQLSNALSQMKQDNTNIEK